VSAKRHLPRITRVELTDFSLYANMRSIEVPIERDAVFCLAGANGMGKSSFLATINFGLTGIVASPTRNFIDVDKYYDESIAYSSRYFDGRVGELDHSSAQVSLGFIVGAHIYHISRGLFSPTELRHFEVHHIDGTTLREQNSDLDDDARHDLYRDQLVRDCNLGSFEQFVFLQHFLLSFDERRHLIFWDSAVTEPALYLTFGLDASETVHASKLRARIRKAESDARNAQWQATQARNRMQALGVEASELSTIGDLVTSHQSLVAELDARIADLAQREQGLRDAHIAAAEASARQTSIRLQYDEVFQSRRAEIHDPERHPLVRTSLVDQQCGVCGTVGEQVTRGIRTALNERVCPLCSSSLNRHTDKATADSLRALDDLLAEAAEHVNASAARVKRLAGDLMAVQLEKDRASMALAEFEAQHATRLPGLKTASGSLVEQSSQLALEKQSAERRRDEYRRLRDRLRDELRPIQERLSEAYREAELEFVPAFRALAYKFIGLDLDVFLEPKEDSLELGLEVEGIRRRSTTQLSESQRFFLDIALRMALAEHMTNPSEGASLIIDTPEGSLDIAYEARAGDMFADFVERGNQIVMTANINASQLLKRLATRCTQARMQLIRMTDWAPLSEVQASEEALFDEAYSNIEHALVYVENES